MTGQALDGARDRLRDLEGQTAHLQGQADAEAQALTAAQDEARTGKAPLRLVVAAQGLADAARGLLRRHLGDVEGQRAQVQELEQAHAAAQLIERGRAAQAEADRAAQEAAEIVAQAEAALSDALTRFHALRGTHSAARSEVLTCAQQHAAHALNLTSSDVSDAMSYRGLTGQLGADRRAAVTDALNAYGAQVGTSAYDLARTADRTAPELSPGRLGDLMPRHLGGPLR